MDEAGDELHPRLGNGTQFAELRGANPEMSRWFQEAFIRGLRWVSEIAGFESGGLERRDYPTAEIEAE